MTNGDRIQAIQRFGFSRRQAGFLVIVMSYSGVCLPRQFATLAVGGAWVAPPPSRGSLTPRLSVSITVHETKAPGR